MATYQRWFIDKSELINLTPVKARDLVCRCFLEAQKEKFAGAAESLGVTAKDDDIQKTVVGALRAAFHDAGGEYESPTKQTLSEVVADLARKSVAWGTPKAIVDHHRAQIEEVLHLLA